MDMNKAKETLKQYENGGHFFNLLYKAAMSADTANLEKLHKAYPVFIEAVCVYKGLESPMNEENKGMQVKTEKLKSFPVSVDGKCHAYKHDAFHMGRQIGKDLLMMFANHDDKECKYFILIDENTGKRVKVIIE
jgi:hypothetical protein